MNWSTDTISNLNQKVAVVTGANSGIGFETVKVLAEKGAHVVMACRNPERGNAALERIRAANPVADIELMTLDLTSLLSVRRFSDALAAQYGQLDLLINNAGIMGVPYGRTHDGFESHFGTNHLAHFALTGRLLPLLEQANDARIVVVSSICHRAGSTNFHTPPSERSYFRWSAYAHSKLANLIFAKELHRRLRKHGSGVRAMAAHPGYSNTNLQRYVLAGDMLNHLFSQPQELGAHPTLYAATARHLKGGEYIGPTGFLELKGPPGLAFCAQKATNQRVAEELWHISETLTGQYFLSSP